MSNSNYPGLTGKFLKHLISLTLWEYLSNLLNNLLKNYQYHLHPQANLPAIIDEKVSAVY